MYLHFNNEENLNLKCLHSKTTAPLMDKGNEHFLFLKLSRWRHRWLVCRVPQAREAGLALAQEVDSLTVRLADSTPTILDSAQRLAKEVGVLSDVGRLTEKHGTQRVPLRDPRLSLTPTVPLPHCVCVAGGGQHGHPPVAAAPPAGAPPLAAAQQQHSHQEAGGQRGDTHTHTHRK